MIRSLLYHYIHRTVDISIVCVDNGLNEAYKQYIVATNTADRKLKPVRNILRTALCHLIAIKGGLIDCVVQIINSSAAPATHGVTEANRLSGLIGGGLVNLKCSDDTVPVASVLCSGVNIFLVFGLGFVFIFV